MTDKKLKILIVDDNASSREILENIIKSLKFKEMKKRVYLLLTVTIGVIMISCGRKSIDKETTEETDKKEVKVLIVCLSSYFTMMKNI